MDIQEEAEERSLVEDKIVEAEVVAVVGHVPNGSGEHSYTVCDVYSLIRKGIFSVHTGVDVQQLEKPRWEEHARSSVIWRIH